MTQPFRLSGGRIDRAAPVTFRWNGMQLQGFAGDTLASALLANGERLVGRSFKYHRPRGILTAGSEEPNGLVTIGTGVNADPNVRATMQEIFNGLQATPQNCWPSLRFDALAVNDALSPFLGAGFYYKTFMWPKVFWEAIYEPIIRQAAGLGALPEAIGSDHHEKAFAHCDVLVIGAGPSGLMAALTAARGGADVILATEDTECGGRLLSEVEEIDGKPCEQWADDIVDELASMDNLRIMTRTTVTGAYDGGTYGALERVSRHRSRGSAPRDCFWRIVADRAVLAAGALERPQVFADNDRPGIMLAGAVRSYLARYGVGSGRKVAVFAGSDDGQRTAQVLSAAGVEIAAVIDPREGAASKQGDWPVWTGAQVIATRGRLGVTDVTLRHSGGTERIEIDCLAVSGGWNPSVHLSCHQGARPVWDAELQAFVPKPDAIPGVIVAGAAAGRFSTADCLKDGTRAGNATLAALGMNEVAMEVPRAEDGHYDVAPISVIEGRGRKWLDFQNDVTIKDVGLAAQEGFRSVEHMKRYTTQGMATDQGKTSNVAALAVLADATGREIAATGTTTFRPPFVPVPIAAMGAGGQGHGFAPERHTTTHAATLARGAPMIEAALWYRPSWFPAPKDTTWQDSRDREVRMVRGAVGVCDVSTLGKIDVQGPHAGAFLDLLYAGAMSSLKPGGVRYGVMLREDGHVLDDGTVARLGDTRFVVTTTTAAAGQVMRHIEYVRQVVAPQMDVAAISVTDHWAQFAVAGPQSRRLLNGLLETEVNDGTLPYMGCADIRIAGVSGRMFRISFSGEHAYEVAVPARHGAALWRLLLAQAEGLGGGPYGMEALNVLRIEKGFLTHAEIDGRVSLHDLGMERMMKGDFIGRVMAGREGLTDPDRPCLVGLRPIDPRDHLTAGAFVFDDGAEATRENAKGHITSACHSATLGHDIALAFVSRGPERIGQPVRVVDHVRDRRTVCEITAPVFFDPDGGRLRG